LGAPVGSQKEPAQTAGQPEPLTMPYFRCSDAHDVNRWDWGRPPVSTYVVCASARAGSTWLCEELAWRGLAEPLEYLNPKYVKYFAWRWECRNLAQYRVMMWRRRTSQDGRFGLKVLGMHFFDLYDDLFATLLNEPPPHDPNMRRRVFLEKVVPDPTYVWLRRRDKHRQAVSLWLADSTAVWMQYSPEDPREFGSLRYDFDAIDQRRRACETEEALWERFFEETGIKPRELSYEDLLSNPDPLLGSLAADLGGSPERQAPPSDYRNHVQSNATTEALVARYRSDLAAGRAPTSVS